jgi:hypothetical protein
MVGWSHDILKKIIALYDRVLVDRKWQRYTIEELKKGNQILWIKEMKKIDAGINEIIYAEYIYNWERINSFFFRQK